MPTYLCHGFRWQRRSVRVFVVVQNLDDASPEWIIPARSSRALLEAFYNLFDFLPFCAAPDGSSSRGSNTPRASEDVSAPSNAAGHERQPPTSPHPIVGMPAGDDLGAQDWSVVKLLEEYDPMNLEEVSRPHTYVADYVVRVGLSASIAEEIQKYEERVRASRDPPMTALPSDETTKRKPNKKPGWFEKLRDQLQRGEPLRWYVVVNGDEVRDWPDEKAPLDRTAEMQARMTHHPPPKEPSDEHQDEDERLQQRLDLGGGDTERLRNDLRKGPRPEDRSSMQSKASKDSSTRPKTPSRGGFRRLFGRGKDPDFASPPPP